MVVLLFAALLCAFCALVSFAAVVPEAVLPRAGSVSAALLCEELLVAEALPRSAGLTSEAVTYWLAT